MEHQNLLKLHTDEEEESLVRLCNGPNNAEEQPLIRVFLDLGSRAILASRATEQLS